ncbi:MAG TPA: flippase [Candidatus Paceibacterota bacterium]|nr:flippase [Candidatus Paceibacterota bacterium]
MLEKIKNFLFKNTTTRQTVAKNTVWLSISNFGGRIIKAVIVIYAARALGTAGYGVFSYAITLAGFFGIFVDPGINSVLIREGAKSTPEERQSLFSTTLIMKAVILAASVVIVIMIAPFFSTLPGAKVLLPLVALVIVFDNTREFLSSLFRSEEKMQWDAASFLLENLAITVFGFIFLMIAATPKSFMNAYVVGTAVGALSAIWLLRGRFKNILAGASAKRMLAIIKTAWPFAITGALGILLTSTDVLIISWMKTASDVGIYSAAIRIIQTLYLVPGVIQLSTLPLFARLAKRDNEKFRRVLERTVAFIFLISIPISLGGIILGTQIMRLVFGVGYIAGGLALSILMLNLSFDYAGSVIANGIFAYDHQKNLIISSAIAGISNVLFDILFIPHWGMTGSAFATLIAQILGNTYLWYAMKKLNPFSVFPRLGRIGAAGVIMACATILLLIGGVEVIVNIAVSGAIYLFSLWILGEPVLTELRSIVTAAA